jgi:hypothetical protein
MFFPLWACGAAGSALPWHGRGHRFDPDQVHQSFKQLSGTPSQTFGSKLAANFKLPCSQAMVRRADEGTLSRLLVEASILLAASHGNPSTILKEAAMAYKVDTEAIATKVKQEFAAKEKAKKVLQPTGKAAKKAA